VKRGGWKKIVLDLRGADCVAPQTDPDPLRPLLQVRHHLRQDGCRLVLCSLSASLAELFRATWLLGLFEVQPDVAAALASLAG
jgi:anti-anti-sigma regulatory factor